MNYEKAYKEALERAKAAQDSAKSDKENGVTDKITEYTIQLTEVIFPELKESEDERIRKWLIEKQQEWLRDQERGGYMDNRNLIKTIKESISWLEKQGSQKPTEKFKFGDWIIRNADMGFKPNIYLVTEVKDYYVCEDVQGRRVTFTFNDVHKNFKLWNISDAKDGDVLATPYYILIFKEHLKDNGGLSYCHYDFGSGNPQFIWNEDNNWYFYKGAVIQPATKEQRDQLFSKMKEAGYEWDSEKKRLKKSDWVDLGLPSGTLWKSTNEANPNDNHDFYAYDEAVEEKDLLLKDLCGRLPYVVKVVYLATTYTIQYMDARFDEVKLEGMPYTVGIGYIKPYLRPMSSMTEEEKDFYDSMFIEVEGDYLGMFPTAIIDWLNAHHFDYRGLIEKGLAIEAPEGMYNN